MKPKVKVVHICQKTGLNCIEMQECQTEMRNEKGKLVCPHKLERYIIPETSLGGLI